MGFMRMRMRPHRAFGGSRRPLPINSRYGCRPSAAAWRATWSVRGCSPRMRKTVTWPWNLTSRSHPCRICNSTALPTALPSAPSRGARYFHCKPFHPNRADTNPSALSAKKPVSASTPEYRGKRNHPLENRCANT